MKNKNERPAEEKKEPKKQVVLLKDLAPRGEVKGGAAKVPFGAQVLREGGGKGRPSGKGP
ncbi:MAG TPA: hypothetical protein VIC59_12695 [Gemmatimonadota bacterium]|jgi:hypothetical protein